MALQSFQSSGMIDSMRKTDCWGWVSREIKLARGLPEFLHPSQPGPGKGEAEAVVEQRGRVQVTVASHQRAARMVVAKAVKAQAVPRIAAAAAAIRPATEHH